MSLKTCWIPVNFEKQKTSERTHFVLINMRSKYVNLVFIFLSEVAFNQIMPRQIENILNSLKFPSLTLQTHQTMVVIKAHSSSHDSPLPTLHTD